MLQTIIDLTTSATGLGFGAITLIARMAMVRMLNLWPTIDGNEYGALAAPTLFTMNVCIVLLMLMFVTFIVYIYVHSSNFIVSVLARITSTLLPIFASLFLLSSIAFVVLYLTTVMINGGSVGTATENIRKEMEKQVMDPMLMDDSIGSWMEKADQFIKDSQFDTILSNANEERQPPVAPFDARDII